VQRNIAVRRCFDCLSVIKIIITQKASGRWWQLFKEGFLISRTFAQHRDLKDIYRNIVN